MIGGIAIVSLAIFAVALPWCGVIPAVTDALAISRRSAVLMRDPSLDDRGRERAARDAARRLAGCCGAIALRAGLALACAAAPIVIGGALGFAPPDRVLGFLSRWDVAAVATVAMGVVFWAQGRRWAAS